ncbi:MAG: glycine--tRNA ligase subunit beta, partial [Paracoccaceae bacterium]
DEKPTGSKDPFALRRAALGVIRLVLGNGLRIAFTLSFAKAVAVHHLKEQLLAESKNKLALNELDRIELIHAAGELSSDEAISAMEKVSGGQRIPFSDIEAVASDLLAFFHDRLKVHLRDEGIRHDVIDACLAMPGNDDLTLLVKRAEALSAFLKTEDGENLLQGFKRANNILLQAEEKDGVEYRFGADPKFAEGPEEKHLFAALDSADKVIGPAMEAEGFSIAMGAMADLRAPIDAFFEAVQVNAENQVLRRNRLNLLHRIRETCLAVADLTKIEG